MYHFSKLSVLLVVVWIPSECLAFTHFTHVDLQSNDLVYDPNSNMLYASVPSVAGAARGNTITPIDPYTGALGSSVFVASEPSVLAIADDGSVIYVASESTNLVTPFSLATMTPGTAFAIGSGDRRVDDMEVAPGDATALAVSRRMGNTNKGIAFFVNGVQLPSTTTDSARNDVIEFGDDPNTLYGHANSLSDRDFNSFAVDFSPAGGFGGTNYHVKHLLTQGGLDMEYEDGRMYFTNGQVLEVNTPGPIGSFNGSGPVEPVASTSRTYFIDSGKLKSFSQTTFVPLGEISIPGLSGTAKNLVSLGDDGLAFATNSGQIIIARGSLVLGPTADFDQNGLVDGNDFLTWQINAGIGTKLGEGDSNGDGAVNGADLAVWEDQYGTSLSIRTAEAVPEPRTCSLALVVLFLALIKRGLSTESLTVKFNS